MDGSLLYDSNKEYAEAIKEGLDDMLSEIDRFRKGEISASELIDSHKRSLDRMDARKNQ